MVLFDSNNRAYGIHKVRIISLFTFNNIDMKNKEIFVKMLWDAYKYPKSFDYYEWVSACGTICCFGGRLPKFTPKFVYRERSGAIHLQHIENGVPYGGNINIMDGLCEFFDLPREVAKKVFVPQCAKTLDSLADTVGVDNFIFDSKKKYYVCLCIQWVKSVINEHLPKNDLFDFDNIKKITGTTDKKICMFIDQLNRIENSKILEDLQQ